MANLTESATWEDKVECIIKLGGSVVTKKTELETVNDESLCAAAEVLGGLKRCIVVHGAGSFGHFQASKYGVAHGYRHLNDEETARTQAGFCKTRLSVTKLNHIIVQSLVDRGIPAVGLAPCYSWRTKGRSEVVAADCEGVSALLDQGFIPVLHGDAVLDEKLGCTILSGDTIIRELCVYFKPRRVIFLSDVEGIYTRPPSEPDANLIPKILVKSDRSIATDIATSNLAHDVTGGIKAKISAACSIVEGSGGSIRVFVCKLGTDSARAACRQRDLSSSDFQGTIIQKYEDDSN